MDVHILAGFWNHTSLGDTIKHAAGVGGVDVVVTHA